MAHKEYSIVKFSGYFLIVTVAKNPKQYFFCCWGHPTRVGWVKPLDNIACKSPDVYVYHNVHGNFHTLFLIYSTKVYGNSLYYFCGLQEGCSHIMVRSDLSIYLFVFPRESSACHVGKCCRPHIYVFRLIAIKFMEFSMCTFLFIAIRYMEISINFLLCIAMWFFLCVAIK